MSSYLVPTLQVCTLGFHCKQEREREKKATHKPNVCLAEATIAAQLIKIEKLQLCTKGRPQKSYRGKSAFFSKSQFIFEVVFPLFSKVYKYFSKVFLWQQGSILQVIWISFDQGNVEIIVSTMCLEFNLPVYHPTDIQLSNSQDIGKVS